MGQQQDQRGNQKIPETKENWDTTIQNLQDIVKGSLIREIHSNTHLSQKKKKNLRETI